MTPSEPRRVHPIVRVSYVSRIGYAALSRDTKQAGLRAPFVDALISEETRNEVGNAVQVASRLEVALEGPEESVRLFEVGDLADTAASQPPATEQTVDSKRGPR